MVISGRIQNGVVVLASGASLPEGTEVNVVVRTAPEVQPSLTEPEHEQVVEMIARIAALPIEGATDAFSGRDHDRVLYGRP
jgi:hypothetical protein